MCSDQVKDSEAVEVWEYLFGQNISSIAGLALDDDIPYDFQQRKRKASRCHSPTIPAARLLCRWVIGIYITCSSVDAVQIAALVSNLS